MSDDKFGDTQMADSIDICEELTGYPLSSVVVFDTETTGTSPWSGDEILSISIVDGYGRDLFTSYVRPTRHRSWPDAQRVNGISPRMVRNAPTAREISERVRELLAGNVLVVGYNVNFDIGFLTNQGILSREPLSTFDVMREYADVVLGGGKWVRLSELARRYGYSFSAHDAAEDAKATAYCFRALMTDHEYLRRWKKARYGGCDAMREPHMGQTKETTANVLSLVNSGKTDVRGELRLGEVTRGKTRGAKRYEAYFGESRVGVGETSWVGFAMRLYDSEKPPRAIPCMLSLAASPSKSSCHVRVTARGRYTQRLDRLAELSARSWAEASGRAAGDAEAAHVKDEPAAQSNGMPASTASHGKIMREEPRGCPGVEEAASDYMKAEDTQDKADEGYRGRRGLRGLFRKLGL